MYIYIYFISVYYTYNHSEVDDRQDVPHIPIFFVIFLGHFHVMGVSSTIP